ncbi:MAG: hypothetical protein EBX41_05445 [Chitinophagia bacterium]|nr:hypothetical protein [Chitinophagia bacterium]
MLFSQSDISAKERPIVPPPPLPKYKYSLTLFKYNISFTNTFYDTYVDGSDAICNGVLLNRTVYKHWGISVGYQAPVSFAYILNNRLKDSKSIISSSCPNCDTGTYIKRFIYADEGDYKEFLAAISYSGHFGGHHYFALQSGIILQNYHFLVHDSSVVNASTETLTRYQHVELYRNWNFMSQASYEYQFLKNHVGIGIDIRYRKWLEYKPGNAVYGGIRFSYHFL